jgi:hypothetical protein
MSTRWGWRLRVERTRLAQSVRAPRLLANPRLGFAVLAGAWVGAVAFGLLSGAGKTLTTLAGGILNTALVSLVFGAFLYLGSNRRIAGRVRTTARRSPHVLLDSRRPGHDATGTIRETLYADLAQELVEVPPPSPQVIVGPVGSGKTTVLVGLARFLAERGMVPVYVPLRGQASLDFLALAHDRFLELVDEHVGTVADGERVWRWLCRSRRLVVLADDVDESRPEGDAGYALREALRVARRRGLALAVTSRPLGIPDSVAMTAVALSPLSHEQATAEALAAVEPCAERTEREVCRLVEAGEVGEAPFYLQAVAELAQVGALPAPAPTRHATRAALLAAYADAVVARRLRRETPLGAKERSATVAALRTLALQEIDSAGVEIPLARAAAAIGGHDPLLTIDAAERLELLERGPGCVRFAHDVVQAHLAAALLRDDPERLRRLSETATTPRALSAVLLAAAGTADDAVAETACAGLLAGAAARGGDWGLVLVRTAADVIQGTASAQLREQVIVAARPYAPADEAGVAPTCVAGSLTKLATVPRLARLGTGEAWHLLWDFTNDPDYAVKWAAACELRAHATVAYAELRDRFGDYLADARVLQARRPPEQVDDWRDREVFRLKMLGWVLPSLGTRLAAAGEAQLAEQADEQWDELARLERAPVTCQKGLEASVAQGLKADAWEIRVAGSAVPPARVELARRRVETMLEAPGAFWYSRIQLVHALALLAGAGEARRADARRTLERIAAATGEHPFTAEAARLALRSIGAAAWRRDVWDDEGVVVSGRCKLSAEAAQLVADVVLVLDLNEQGDEAQRARFGTRDELPHCLSASPDRAEILGERGCSCDFGLCPYERSASESATRDLSKAFCRQQRHVAKRRTPKRRQRISKARLAAFWQGMEERARV